MPEAVIVSAARSPIGRANKGSLKDLRPDDLTALIIKTALDKVPGLDPNTVDDLYLGCGLPGGESGNNMARVVNVLNGMDDVPGATLTRYCASSVQTTRMAFHAIKAGEGDVFVSAGVETVSRFAKGTSDHWPDTHNPLFDEAKARTAKTAEGGSRLARPARGRRRSPTSTSRWARPPRTSPGCAASSARSSTSSASGRRTSPRRRSTTASGPARSRRSPRPTAPRSSQGRRPARRASRSRRSPSSTRSSAPTAWSPPATAARSTTAPPRS